MSALALKPMTSWSFSRLLAVDPLLEVIRINVRELLPYAVAFRYPGEEATT